MLAHMQVQTTYPALDLSAYALAQNDSNCNNVVLSSHTLSLSLLSPPLPEAPQPREDENRRKGKFKDQSKSTTNNKRFVN